MSVASDIDRYIWNHQYDKAIKASQDVVETDVEIAALAARALRAKGDYHSALPLFERVDVADRANPAAPGNPGQRIDIACLQWMLGRRDVALEVMKDLTNGILNGTINYGDNAGGVSQGILLYYMATSTSDLDGVEHALRYMKNRAGRLAIEVWPGPVARYYLNEVGFDFVLSAATGESDLHAAIRQARTNLRKRRSLCVALFHDGVRHRVAGDEALCIERMRLCYSLENPIIENEWYLARYETEQSPSPVA